MKHVLFLTTLLLWASCQNSDKDIKGEIKESRARVVSNLAVDGCDWHLEIANTDSSLITTLVPTLATEPKVKAIIPKYGTEDAYSFIDVNLKYRMAGTQRGLTCGFGKTATVDEVEIIQISRLE